MKNIPINKTPIIAGLLSLAQVGLGHLFIQNYKRGILLFLGSLGLSILFYLSFYLPNSGGKIAVLFILLCLLGLIYFYALVEAVIQARHIEKLSWTRSKRFKVCLLFFAISYAMDFTASNAFNSSFEFIKNSSKRLPKALLYGEHFVAQKNTDVQQGKLAIFTYPNSPTPSIQRVIAKGGDRVEIRERVVYVNDKPLNEPYVSYVETPPAYLNYSDDFTAIKIPPNHSFMLSDIRNSARDSRTEGVVSDEDILGVASFVYFSKDTESGKIRWKRLGKAL